MRMLFRFRSTSVAAPPPRRAAAASAHCRNGGSSISIDSMEFAAFRRRPGARRGVRRKDFAAAWRGKLAAIAEEPRGGRAAGRGGAGLRGAAGSDRPRHVLRVPALRLATPATPPAAKFYGDAQRAGDRACRRPSVLRARAQPARRRQARGGDGDARARPLPPLARGHPQGEAAPARRRDRATFPRKVGVRRRRLEPPVRRDDRRRCASISRARA